MSNKIPRSNENDYRAQVIAERQQFLEEKTGASLDHTRKYSFDPDSMDGNCEHLFGVAHVPIGVTRSPARTSGWTPTKRWGAIAESLHGNLCMS